MEDKTNLVRRLNTLDMDRLQTIKDNLEKRGYKHIEHPYFGGVIVMGFGEGYADPEKDFNPEPNLTDSQKRRLLTKYRLAILYDSVKKVLYSKERAVVSR
jgi:hypothetical protein